ncbi:unnamed protein product, partial [Trichobilharzia regenti]
RRSDSPIPVEERPSGHVTQALVAKFQGLETGNKMNGGGSTQSYSTQNQVNLLLSLLYLLLYNCRYLIKIFCLAQVKKIFD